MAQLFTVVQRKGLDGAKVYNRGIYTTKKLVWEIGTMRKLSRTQNIQMFSSTMMLITFIVIQLIHGYAIFLQRMVVFHCIVVKLQSL